MGPLERSLSAKNRLWHRACRLVDSRSETAPTILLAVVLTLLTTACGGGGGGGAAAAGNPGPGVGGGAANSAFDYTDVDELVATITDATVPADGRLIVAFQLTDEFGFAIDDLTAGDIRLTIAKLEASFVGNNTGNWQSYINDIEMPGVGPGTEPRLQAIVEDGIDGVLTNHQDGTYDYRFAASIINITDQAVLDQAAREGLDLSYEDDRTHRVAMEFRNIQNPVNASFDWVPRGGIAYSFDVAATENCNGCHQKLALHGGTKVAVRYCVTCHNPGTTDANSGNTVSFREMIHKIHFGRDLPSVQGGTPYVIYGYQDRPHDYSDVNYPQDVRNCENCHAGNLTASGDLMVTNAGDNWTEFSTMSACGACHDDLDFAAHFGGQPDDTNCMSCHRNAAVAGSIMASHRMPVAIAREAFEANILDITSTAPGELTSVRFSITDPTNNDAPYDILNDEPWTQPAGASRLAVTLGWSTGDFTNTGNGGDGASTVSINALATALDNGDGSFTVTSGVAIPDGSQPPNIPAGGSGAVAIEGHPAVDVGDPGASGVQQVPLTNVVGYFNIDEPSGNAVPRREVVDLSLCLDCHQALVLHGNNRSDSIESCVTCHNARNTDKSVRLIAQNPPTDGKDEESLDAKTLVHAIHASAFRDNPLQVVGFMGFSTHVYDEEHVQYPGILSNCLGCHVDETYAVPLSAGVLGNTFDTGADIADPADDRVISPTSAVCASCHDQPASQAHMEANGGDFDTTQAALDSGAVLEQCGICHGAGRSADVAVVHGLQ